MAEIRFAGVHHRFGERVVLDGIDLTLTERRVGIVGANGSGKSTLARMINGLVRPTTGTVTVDGLDTIAKRATVRRRVGFVFTDPDNQIVMPTVAEDVAFSLRRSGLATAEVAERVRQTLARFDLAGPRRSPDPPALRRAEAAAGAGGGAGHRAAGAGRRRADDAAGPAATPGWCNDLLAGLPDEQVVLVTHHLHLLDGFDRVVVLHEGRWSRTAPPTRRCAAYTGAADMTVDRPVPAGNLRAASDPGRLEGSRACWSRSPASCC